MKKLLIPILIIPFIWSCGGSGDTTDANDDQNSASQTDPSPNSVNNENIAGANIDFAIADNFCSNETKLKLLSTVLLSAYSAKGNSPDLNYCGGSSELIEEDSGNFQILLNDYCVNFRGEEIILNGGIDGAVESGANFISSIIPDLSITGRNYNLTVSGNTWDGRADDMFLNLFVSDNIGSKNFALENVSIKKGEIDFGFFSFADIGPYEFKFINHFNEDLTEGLLFIYGEGEELLILTAEDHMVSVVYKANKKDPGTWIDSASCNG